MIGLRLRGGDDGLRPHRAFGRVLDGRRDLIQRRGGFFKPGRLLLGAPRQIVRRLGDFAGCSLPQAFVGK